MLSWNKLTASPNRVYLASVLRISTLIPRSDRNFIPSYLLLLRRKNRTLNIQAKIFVRNGNLIVALPMTNPTGKIWVKRRNSTSNYGLLITKRREKLTKNDWLLEKVVKI